MSKKLDAKAKKNTSKNKPGYDWVAPHLTRQLNKTNKKYSSKTKKDSSAYICGQAEAQLDIVPGLMPAPYVMGRLDAKTKKNASKNKPGYDWVADPGTKGGGYYRKSRGSGTGVATKVAAALVVGAGAAAVAAAANRNRTSSAPTSSNVVGAGANAITNKNKFANAKTLGAATLAAGTVAGSAYALRRKPPAPISPTPTAVKWKKQMEEQELARQSASTEEGTLSTNTAEPATETFKKTTEAIKGKKTSTTKPSKYEKQPDPWTGLPVEDPFNPEGMDFPDNQPSKKSAANKVVTTQLPQLPPTKEYKRKFAPNNTVLRKQLNKSKRELTEIEKAKDKVELGQRLQENVHSPADMRRGVDVEMAAAEKISNLESKSPSRTPAGLVTIRGRNPNSVSPKNKPGKKKEVGEEEAVAAEPQPEVSKDKKKKGDKSFKSELAESAAKGAGKYVMKEGRKQALNKIAPGLGDGVNAAFKMKGDLTKIAEWAEELEKGGDQQMSRRNLFKKAGRAAANQAVSKPEVSAKEIRRGAEVSQQFFDRLFDQGDKVILKGGRTRLGVPNRSIQLSPKEFDRITRDYTNADRRALRSFLDLVGFPLP